MITLENISQKTLDEEKLFDLIKIGQTPELTVDEVEAITSGYKGNSLSLLSENVIIHKRSILTVIVTKTLTPDLNVPDFIQDLLECCKFDLFIQIGKFYL